MKTAISKDGTRIAYDGRGNGPAMILVDGAFCSRALGPMQPLVPLLAQDFTVYTYDRRGRNESGDTLPYSPEREIEDLAAVIEAAGGTAMLFGVSSGAALAILAAERGLKATKLALYEPPFHLTDADLELRNERKATLRQLIQENRRSEAVSYFQVQIIGLPRLINFILRLLPMWKKLKAVAHTLCYDLEVLGDGTLPAERISRLGMPTLVIAGEKTPKFLRDSSEAVASKLPHGSLALLKGQSHNVSAKAIAPVLRKFFS